MSECFNLCDDDDDDDDDDKMMMMMQVSDWSTWSNCSNLCGRGWMTMARSVVARKDDIQN